MAQTSLIIGDTNWAVKEDSLLGYNVIQNNYLPIPIDCVRATTATRVNSAGLIEVVPRNFIQFSQELDNAVWIKSVSTISPNATTAPNGTLTADKFIADAVNSTHQLIQPTDSNAYVFSIYAKAAEETVFSMWIANATKRAEFNLATGTIPLSTVANSSIVNVGNGWYRCSVYDASPSTTYRIYGRTGGVYTGNGVDGMFFWGAQLDLGTTATEYFPTTDRLDIPRIDYSTGTASLLVEPQRTNLFLRSEEFDSGAVWFTINSTVVANNTTSPNGTTNADKLIATATTSTHIVLQQPAGSVNGTTVTVSVFAKASGLSNITLLNNAGGSGVANYNLSTGITTLSSGVAASIQNYGNGWYRCIMTYTPTTTGNFNIQIRLADNSGNTTFLGNGIDGVSLWGAQIETGSYATSYIPTIASTVTRNTDIISRTGISGLIGQTEGTIFCDVTLNSRVSFTYFAIAPNLASAANYLGIGFSNNAIFFESVVSGVLQGGISHSNTSTGRFKIAAAYKANDFILYINGTQIGVDTSGNVPTCSEIGLAIFSQAQALNYNSAQLYKTRLTNSELASLTTI